MGDVNTIIGIIAGIVAIITGIYQFVKWLNGAKQKAQRVILKENNLFAIYKDGKEQQLTFNANVSQFVYADKKGIIYFFQYKKVEHYKVYQLLNYNTSKHTEEVIVDQKPFPDGNDRSFKLLSPRDLTLSPNQKKAYFSIEAFATGSMLVEINLKPKQSKNLFSAESIEFILSGKYKGHILVGVSAIKGKGRDIYYEVRNLEGDILKEFSDYDEYMNFRGSLSWKDEKSQ